MPKFKRTVTLIQIQDALIEARQAFGDINGALGRAGPVDKSLIRRRMLAALKLLNKLYAV